MELIVSIAEYVLVAREKNWQSPLCRQFHLVLLNTPSFLLSTLKHSYSTGSAVNYVKANILRKVLFTEITQYRHEGTCAEQSSSRTRAHGAGEGA